MKKDLIQQYNNITEQIVKEFVKRYYKEIYDEDEVDYEYDYRLMSFKLINSWPVEISNEFYSIDDILITLKHNIPLKIVQEYFNAWYEASLDNKPLWVNLYNFWRMKVNIDLYNKEEKESLKRSEENVKIAKKELEDILKNK